MNFYPIVGRCSSFTSNKLKEIGYKNILGFEITEDAIYFYTKPTEDKPSEVYELRFKLSGTVEGELDTSKLITK